MQTGTGLHGCSQGAAAECPCNIAECNPAVGASEVGDALFRISVQVGVCES